MEYSRFTRTSIATMRRFISVHDADNIIKWLCVHEMLHMYKCVDKVSSHMCERKDVGGCTITRSKRARPIKLNMDFMF